MISSKIRQFFSTPRQAQVTLPSQRPLSAPLICQLSIKAPNILLVHFSDSNIPALSPELNGMASCYCVGPDAVFHFCAKIGKVLGERDLQMTIVEVTSYPQRRRFFRVDTDVLLKYWPVQITGRPPCEAEQKKVNLSAVGLRFETTQFLKYGEKINIEMQLPGDAKEVINCMGRVVRVGFSDNQRVEDVAIDLMDVRPEEQEKLIKFCLAEQRRQIRLKVRVLDPGIN